MNASEKPQNPMSPEELEPIGSPSGPLRIFVNRNLRMDTIKAVGFDMDYTLARYHRATMESLAHKLTIEKLISHHGYPEEIRGLKYDGDFVIRGLTVDKELGHILKLDRHNHVARAFHGRAPLTKRQRRDTYRSERMHYVPPRFAVVDTLFHLPEMCLYADLIDFFDAHPKFHADPWKVFDDTRAAIDGIHADDSLKTVIKADIGNYVERDPLLARTLHKLRSSGKRLFVLTNSHWPYTQALMSYLLDNELPEYTSWRSYFEFVVVAGRKPGFFTGDVPIAEIDEEGAVVRRPVKKFQRGRIYEGGNLKDFETAAGFGGEEILYVGDHIYGDILRSKKTSLWRTALVVEELEQEVRLTEENREPLAEQRKLEEQRRDLDTLANVQRQRLGLMEKEMGSEIARQDPEFLDLRAERDQTKRKLKATLRRLEKIQESLDKAFSKNWGMLFKEQHENSRFGDQVEDFACIYMSRVSNFLYYSAHQYFRSYRDLMPHERYELVLSQKTDVPDP